MKQLKLKLEKLYFAALDIVLDELSRRLEENDAKTNNFAVFIQCEKLSQHSSNFSRH